MESLPIPLQAVYYEISSVMLDAKLEMNVLKIKAEKLHLNQMHDKNIPIGATTSIELQTKQHVNEDTKVNHSRLKES